MTMHTGYLRSYSNPNFSGIATITLDAGEGITAAYIESGGGTRMLVAALGGSLNGETLATYEIDDLGLVVSVTPEEES